jgi:hypothetical protein
VLTNKEHPQQLVKDLENYDPRPWRWNVPGKAYTLRIEDMVPALSGVVGKIALAAAFAMAWSSGLKIADPTFVAENVRLELFVAALFALLFSAVLNPSAGPPGTLAPLIPVIPVMIAAGVHPLPFAVLVGLFGIIIASLGFFRHIVRINGPGTRGGVLLLFGILGVTGSLENLQVWTDGSHHENLLFPLLILGAGVHLFLGRRNMKWLVIPACAVLALLVSALFGLFPTFDTPAALPILDPNHWWNVKWGIGYGWTVQNVVVALPFAVLVIAMWPIDALAIISMQESHYPVRATKAIMNLDATFVIVSIRNMLGTILGGGQVAAVWRSFMIPLAVARRPIGGSALLLAIAGVTFAFLGFPIDIAIFPPLVWLVLIFGVFIPMIEIGVGLLHNPAAIQLAILCLVLGIGLNPIVGWSVALVAENFQLISDKNQDRVIRPVEKVITLAVFFLSIISYGFILF